MAHLRSFEDFLKVPSQELNKESDWIANEKSGENEVEKFQSFNENLLKVINFIFTNQIDPFSRFAQSNACNTKLKLIQLKQFATEMVQANISAKEIHQTTPFQVPVDQRNGSLQSLLVQLLPLLLTRTNFQVELPEEDKETANIVLYLQSLVQHSIDWIVQPRSLDRPLRVSTYILMEQCDLDSSLDSVLKTATILVTTSQIESINVFVQESLRQQVAQIFPPKVSPNGLNSFDVPYDMDAVNFDTNSKNGINFYYYRSNEEVVKMLNHLQPGGLLQRPHSLFTSVWCENESLALRLVQDLKWFHSDVIINCGLAGHVALSHNFLKAIYQPKFDEIPDLGKLRVR